MFLSQIHGFNLNINVKNIFDLILVNVDAY